MRFPWLRDVLAAQPDFLTVYMDTTRTRTDGTAAAEMSTRWDHMREQAQRAGAPVPILDEIEDSLLTPAGIAGAHGRAILANSSQILLNRVLPVPPADRVDWGPKPLLLPLMEVAACAVSYILVEVDRSGADFSLRAPEDPNLTGSQGVLGDDGRVEGGHEELHKTGGGGWATRRWDSRVEDSWERNADAVAAKLDKLVRDYRPDMVLLAGDVRAATLLKEAVAPETRSRITDVPGGGRNEGVDREAFRTNMAKVVNDFIDRREQACVDKFIEQESRDGEAVSGVDEVRGALKRGQVDELLMARGREPEEIEELLLLAVETDASVQTVPNDSVNLMGGVGALLRWRDESTPSNSLSSMTGDRRRESAAH